MPNKEQHRAKAERNQKFMESIALDDYPEWVAVAAFYTAVHLVERWRAAAGDGDSTSHEHRMEHVQHKFPADIHTAYQILQNVAMLARYQSNGDFFAQFQPEDVKTQIVDNRLAKNRQFVSP